MEKELKYLREKYPKGLQESKRSWGIRLAKIHADLIASKQNPDKESDKEPEDIKPESDSTPPIKEVEETVVEEETKEKIESEKLFDLACEKGLSFLNVDELLVLAKVIDGEYPDTDEFELLNFVVKKYKNKLTIGEPLPNRIMIKAHYDGYRPGESCLVDQNTYNRMKKAKIIRH